MRSRTKFIIGLLGILLIVSAAVAGFLTYQIRKSYPQTTGDVTLNGLIEQVHIYRDGFGVPLIEASAEEDLLFALGYVHAQDRLWQMDITRRVGLGRLSEIFGHETIPFDRMFRTLGLWKLSQNIETEISPESHKRISSYAAGINAFIESGSGAYPVEFDMLGYSPEPWNVAHAILLGRLMAWELNLSWWADLTLGAIADRVGLQKALDIFPPYPSDIPPVVRTGAIPRPAGLTEGFLETARAFRSYFGVHGTLGGSNAWVVSPRKSASGKVILANDVHLQLQLPAKFYEVHLRAPGYDVSGMSIPGIPGIVIGRNESIAWGLTNVMADDADFYIERLDTIRGDTYFYAGEWRPVKMREEAIQVKGDTAIAVVIRETHHGPIVTDIRTPLQRASSSYVASMRWTGYEKSDQIEAFHKINVATSWEEFLAGVREYSGPGQNFVYGDVEGNIGYWCGLKLPIRGKLNSTLPLPGWEPGAEWKGFVPFDQLPHLLNPPDGYIATANNKIVDDSYPHHISDLWEPPSRIVRLHEILAGSSVFSVADFERMQNDSYSHNAKELLPVILGALESDTVGTYKIAVEYFRNWNYMFAKEDVATSMFQQLLVRLMWNIYRDEMGDSLLHDFVLLVNIPTRVTTKLLLDGTSEWFNDISTEEVESRDDIIRKSMTEALTLLRDRFGNETKTWRWGELHRVTLQHPFGLQKPLDRIFNIGPYPYGGGATSLVSGEYSFNSPFSVTVAASARQIVDLSLPRSSRRVIPGGQSGQIMHRHYDDQFLLWLNGGYRTSQSDKSALSKGETQHLVLEPGQ